MEGIEDFSVEIFGLLPEVGGAPSMNTLRYSELGMIFCGRRGNDLSKICKQWIRKYCKMQPGTSDPSRMGLKAFIHRLVQSYKDDEHWNYPTIPVPPMEPGTSSVQMLFPKMPRLVASPKKVKQTYIKTEEGDIVPIKQEGERENEKKRKKEAEEKEKKRRKEEAEEKEKKRRREEADMSSPTSTPSTSSPLSSSPTTTPSTSSCCPPLSTSLTTSATPEPEFGKGKGKGKGRGKSKSEVTIERSEGVTRKTLYPCNHCSAAFTSKQNLGSHEKRHGDRAKENCTDCQFRGFPSEVSRHQRQNHLSNATQVDKNLWECSYCGIQRTRTLLR